MTRLPDWDARLHAYLASVRCTPFAWGEHDCALFGAGAVIALTGNDFAAPFRGRYSTARGSVRALRKFGAGTLEATFAAHLADRELAFARRGDLVFAQGAVGICVGPDALFVGVEPVAAGRDTWVRYPRADWLRVWTVD